MDSNFGKHDVPLYTGRLTGLRSFAVTPKGELTGVTYAGRWVDGENEAKCALKNQDFYSWDSSRAGTVEHDPQHPVASLNCSCGYYGYFDGNDNEFQHGVNVPAVIEVWGRLTVGEKGFRASRGRIVALVIPKDEFPKNWATKAAHRLACSAPTYGPHGWSWPYLAEKAGCDLPLFPHPTLMDTIINRYPSAKIFPTQEAAVAAFPLTSVETAREIVGKQE